MSDALSDDKAARKAERAALRAARAMRKAERDAARAERDRKIADGARGSRAYTRRQVIALLQLEWRTFERLHAAGALPYVEELQPSPPNNKRYRADLLDRYLSGEWGTSRLLSAHKRGRPRTTHHEAGA
jgi:hypothetical protein